MTFAIYHVDLLAQRCAIQVWLNDVVIAELVGLGSAPRLFAPPINLFLAGLNRLTVEVMPIEEDDPSVAADVVVRVYEKGDPVAHGEGEEVVDVGIMPALLERRRLAAEIGQPLLFPQRFECTFENRGPDFSREILASAPIDDEAALVDHAMHLRDLMVAGNVAGLVDAMAGKIAAYSVAYDHDAAEIRASLASSIEHEYLPRGFIVEFERDDVEVVRHAAGRIWELRRGEQPLIQTRLDVSGNRVQMAVFVGRWGGGLGVVR